MSEGLNLLAVLAHPDDESLGFGGTLAKCAAEDLPEEQHIALWGSQEFYRVDSSVNGGRRQETDLFEGLR